MTSLSSESPPWHMCVFCGVTTKFFSERAFIQHLRSYHCLVEGGSYVCRYGNNDVCCSLPVVGVSAADYAEHVARQHVQRRDSRRLRRTTTESASEARKRDEVKWDVYSGSQNLSCVLNDPNAGKQANIFTRDWGESFTETQVIGKLSHLPDISWSSVNGFVRKYGVLSKKISTEEDQTNKPASHSDVKTNFPLLNTIRSLKDLVQLDLNKIPRIFFDERFNIGKLNTFKSVFVRCQNVNIDSSILSRHDQKYNVVIKGSDQSVQLQQMKLIHYLDTVEIEIAKQVERQSDTFFKSVTSHDEITAKIITTVKLVNMARNEVNKIDETIIQHSLKIFRLKTRIMNYCNVLKKLKLMAIVSKSQSTIESYLLFSDYMSALDLVSISKGILNQDLVLIQSLRYQGSQLSEIEQMIDRKLIEEFDTYLTIFISQRSDSNQDINDDVQFEQIVCGILRQRHFHCVDFYKNKVIKHIKEIVKMIEIEMTGVCDTTVVGQFSLNEQLKCLPLPDWIAFLKIVTSKLLFLITLVKKTKDLIQQTVEKRSLLKLADPGKHHSDLQHSEGKFLSEEDSTKMSSKLNDMMVSICDFANHQVSKMINSYWIVDKASASQFCDLGHVVDDFTEKCRDICGRSSTSLRSAFTAQANKFVLTFHQTRKGKLSLILNSECWKRVDVPIEFQELVNEITQSRMFSILKLNSLGSKPNNVLLVNSEAYVVVGAVLILLKLVTEYCVCASELVELAPNVYRYLVELLQFFNARTCQLLLGTTALFTAGLKTITSRNLCLASRNLQLINCLLPFIIDHFQNQVKPHPKTGHSGSGLKLFNMVKRDTENHVIEIERKVISIVNCLIENQIYQWNASLPVPSKTFRNIVKQFRKLHEAIGDILPTPQLQTIYRASNECFILKLREQLKDMNIVRNTERSTIVTLDIKYYANELEKLDTFSVGDINKILDDIWKAT